MELERVRRAVAMWASGKPLVGRVWLFGSRCRDDHRHDSDLDVAIELDMTAASGIDESGGFATWAFETDGWKEELEKATGFEVHLDQYMGEHTPTIQSGLEQSSVMVYSKGG